MRSRNTMEREARRLIRIWCGAQHVPTMNAGKILLVLNGRTPTVENCAEAWGLVLRGRRIWTAYQSRQRRARHTVKART